MLSLIFNPLRPKNQLYPLIIFLRGLLTLKNGPVIKNNPFIGFLGKKYMEIHVSYMILACIYTQNCLAPLQLSPLLLVTNQSTILGIWHNSKNYQTTTKMLYLSILKSGHFLFCQKIGFDPLLRGSGFKPDSNIKYKLI